MYQFECVAKLKGMCAHKYNLNYMKVLLYMAGRSYGKQKGKACF